MASPQNAITRSRSRASRDRHPKSDDPGRHFENQKELFASIPQKAYTCSQTLRNGSRVDKIRNPFSPGTGAPHPALDEIERIVQGDVEPEQGTAESSDFEP